MTNSHKAWRRTVFRIDGWLVLNSHHLRNPGLYRLWNWIVVQPEMGFIRWLRWYRRKD